MRPAYPLTITISAIFVTIFRYFDPQVARLTMHGTQISEYRVLCGSDPGFVDVLLGNLNGSILWVDRPD